MSKAMLPEFMILGSAASCIEKLDPRLPQFKASAGIRNKKKNRKANKKARKDRKKR
jgi:hypothetical protein